MFAAMMGAPRAHDGHPSGYVPPPLPLNASGMRGPTPWCNWVLHGQVLAGAFPASLDDAETDRILTTLLELGVNAFVCLQAEVNINCPEHQWRAGQGLRPYIRDAQRLLSDAHVSGGGAHPRISQTKLDFLHLSIVDGSVTTDAGVLRLVDDCLARIRRGERLYIHCWGGHGRTGTVVSVILGKLYGLPAAAAMDYCQAFHDARRFPQGVRSPQTAVQRAQVRRLLDGIPQQQPQLAGGLPLPVPTPTPGYSPSSKALLGLGAQLQRLAARPGSAGGKPVLDAAAPTRSLLATPSGAEQQEQRPARPSTAPGSKPAAGTRPTFQLHADASAQPAASALQPQYSSSTAGDAAAVDGSSAWKLRAAFQGAALQQLSSKVGSLSKRLARPGSAGGASR